MFWTLLATFFKSVWKILNKWFVPKRFGKYSDKPWVEVVGGELDPENKARVELDWNDAFIEYLKANSITGRTPEEAVHRWLGLIIRDMDKQFLDMGGNSEYM